MKDTECVSFLRWALPRMGLRWEGFRNVRGQVCKRLAHRARELGAVDLAAYRAYLEANDGEWSTLAALCRVTISRFYRDREVWDCLRAELLPEMLSAAEARGEHVVRAWSAGCASGEEPYTLALIWAFDLAARHPAMSLEVLATDLDDEVLGRARRASYEANSLVELPPAWKKAAFYAENDQFRLRDEIRSRAFLQHADLRGPLPDGPFHLVTCRNLAFTYFDESEQKRIAERIAERLVPGGLLILGGHEHLPSDVEGLTRCDGRPWALRRT